MNKYWIIGSSSGIGKELAKKLDSKGYSLILSSRNEEKLNELNTTLINDHEVAPLDLSDKSVCLNVAKKIIKEDMNSLNIIFMSAAYSPDDYSDYENIINVNMLGLLHILSVTKEYLKNTAKSLEECEEMALQSGLKISI